MNLRIKRLRKEIDSVDLEIMRLMKRRIRLAMRIGSLKKDLVTQSGALHLSSRDQERERVILKHYLRRMESVTTTARTKNLVRAIINANPKLTSKQNKL
ncbi:MAG TPA: chorismate mutase [Pseudobdellovibrionaceae bacterium]|nr:chorismate mutase [Pseudobdellovibrionaceae bacterium]